MADALIQEENIRLSRDLKAALASFSLNPKRGLKVLRNLGILGDSDEDLAKFIYVYRNHLSKTLVGEVIGDDRRKNVLPYYVKNFNFNGVSFLEALRDFLSAFRLPGEAQKIDRVMEAFARAYCKEVREKAANAALQNSDVVYVLSFAIIMLNTDLHSDGVRHKMTKEQFCSNFRGVNGSEAIDDAFLSDIYDTILRCPIKMSEVSHRNGEVVTFMNSECQGWMNKKSGRGQWSRRWFNVNNRCLYYFMGPQDEQPRGILPLEDIRLERTGPCDICLSTANKNGMKLLKVDRKGSNLEYRQKYVVRVDNRIETDKWFAALCREIDNDPFYYDLLRRKSCLVRKNVVVECGYHDEPRSPTYIARVPEQDELL
mmetsp:Transcript_48058/g.124835  ORF Transcript_48058/g.124835 Transcript_48058/m.124835 type:complete len:371 (+) Transcript_48058:156-1268(+)